MKDNQSSVNLIVKILKVNRSTCLTHDWTLMLSLLS